jgi:hypothetical protein
MVELVQLFIIFVRSSKNNVFYYPVKSQRRRGGVGSKNDYSFPPKVH